MIPGFVQLGALAVLLQMVVITAFYGYLRWQTPAPSAGTRTRVNRILASGVVLVGLGQLAALGAVGSLRTAPLLSLRQSAIITDAGFIGVLIGYVVTVAGFILYIRATP